MRKTLIALAVIFTVVLIVSIFSYGTVNSARHFLADVRQVNVGSDQTYQVLQLASSFNSHVSNRSPVCTADSCVIGFTFANPILHILRFPTPPRLDAGLRVENHRIGYIAMFYAVGGGPTPSSAVSILEFNHSDAGPFRLDVLPRTSTTIPRIVVRFDSRASDFEKQSIFDLNLSCLNRPLKCRDAFDLAPALAESPEANSLLPSFSSE